MTARAAKRCVKCSWQGKRLPGECKFFRATSGSPLGKLPSVYRASPSPVCPPVAGESKAEEPLLRHHSQGKGARGLGDRVRGGREGCRLPVFTKARVGKNVKKVEMQQQPHEKKSEH